MEALITKLVLVLVEAKLISLALFSLVNFILLVYVFFKYVKPILDKHASLEEHIHLCCADHKDIKEKLHKISDSVEDNTTTLERIEHTSEYTKLEVVKNGAVVSSLVITNRSLK